MTMTTTATLADSLPGLSALSTRTRTTLLIGAGALLTAAAAQVSFALPWTPVPVTGQTFVVLTTGAAFGAKRGGLSQLLYVLLGATGLPFYANGDGGWTAATGSTGGYLAGFVVAAVTVGWLAERRHDRTVALSIEGMLAGTAVIYLLGTTWLAHRANVSAAEAVELGMTPFVIGDAIKLVAAGAILPTAWRIVNWSTSNR